MTTPTFKPPAGRHTYNVAERFLVGQVGRRLVPGQDVIEYDPSTGEVWINAVSFQIPNIMAAIKAGWLRLASLPEAAAPGTAASDTIRGMGVVQQDHHEAARMGTREQMQARAMEMAHRRPGDPSAAAAAPARPKFEDGRVDRSQAAPAVKTSGAVRNGDSDFGTPVQGIRMRTPSNMGAMSVSTSGDPLKGVVADRAGRASSQALVQEGIVFQTEGISAAAADAVPAAALTPENDAMWSPEGVLGGSGKRSAVAPIPAGAFEDFMFGWIDKLRQLELPVSPAEHYDLIRRKFESLPEWSFDAHWKTRVKQYRALPVLARKVLWLLEGNEILNHSQNPWEPAPAVAEEEPPVEVPPAEPAVEAPVKKGPAVKAAVAAPKTSAATVAKVKTRPADAAAEGPPPRKMSSARTKLTVGASSVDMEDLDPVAVEPGGGED